MQELEQRKTAAGDSEKKINFFFTKQLIHREKFRKVN